MEYIRLLHPRNFDPYTNKFTSVAFRDGNGGASVIRRDCVDATGASLCQHVGRFYPNVGGEPPVFWIFEETRLPPDHRITPKRSRSGDDCHHDITANDTKALNKALKALLKNRLPSDFSICDRGGTHRPATLQELLALKAKYDAELAARVK